MGDVFGPRGLAEVRWPPKPDAQEVSLLIAAANADSWTNGRWTADVEQKMKALTGASHAVALNSCTSAIHAALHAMRCVSSTRVAVPALTFVGTVTGAAHIGARLVPTDVDIDTLTIRETPVNVDIILAVDLHGTPHGLDRNHVGGRPVLTDSCQALGTRIDGRHIGWRGTHAWSFSSAKMVTAPDGGAITTDDRALADRLREIRDYGIEANPGQARANGRVVWRGGHNWRPSELSMALVAHRLTTLDRWVARSRQVTERLHAAIDAAGLWRQRAPANTEPAWHKVRIGPLGWAPDQAIDLERHLDRAAIPTHRWGAIPIHRHPAYLLPPGLQLPAAEAAAENTICLGTEACPPFTWNDDEVDHVAQVINKLGRTVHVN